LQEKCWKSPIELEEVPGVEFPHFPSLDGYLKHWGLIGGLFIALVSGGCEILFSPLTFIKNPLLWLETISKHQATHTAGPNFAFELVIRRLEYSDKDKVYVSLLTTFC
jgi:acyl-CoA synthetase (AMP-forming)/AMP-acid ligase II